MQELTERLPKRLARDPLASMRTDSDIEAVADAVMSLSDMRGGGMELLWDMTAKHLLCACLGYLRDWCPPYQRTMSNLSSLVRAALPGDSGGSGELDSLFCEIRSGCKPKSAADGTVTWEPSGLVRCDGVTPRDTNGLRPADDYSLSHYTLYMQSALAPTRKTIVLVLTSALSRCDSDEGA